MNEPKVVKVNKKEASIKKNKTEANAPPNPADQLYAIRDLLFGEQVQRLEQKMQEQNNLLNDRLDSLEALINKNNKEFNKQISAVSQEITSNLETNRLEHVSQEGILEDKLSSLDNRLSEFQEITDNNLREAHKSLVDVADEINQSLQKEVERLTKKMDITSAELGSNKADRKTLANLLESMASNLTETQA